MSNTIKYSTQTENNTLKKGDFVIGVNNVDYGPTSETGYHNTITPPEGGYVVYKNRGDNQRSIYVAQNDEELVTLKDDFGATGSTANDVLVWAAQQDDVLILNNPLDNIVTDGLVLYLDAGFTCSYPKSNTTWYDLSGNGNDGTLVNATFSNNTIQFDGTNDYVIVGNVGSNSVKTVVCWFSMNNVNTNMALFGFGTVNTNTQDIYMWAGNDNGPFGFNHWNSDSWGYAGGEDDIKNKGFFQVIAEFNFSDYTNNRLWINGVSKTLSNQKGTNIQRTQSNNFGIGYNGWNTGSQTWNGSITSILVYDRAFTDSEVLQNYNAQKSRFGIGWASATEILEYNPDATSGYYNIQPLGTSTSVSVYCDMETDGGGWMHVGTISDNNENSNNSTDHPWGYPLDPTQDTGIWEDTTTLNEETPSFTGDYKNRIWYTAPFTQILIKDQGNTQRNLLYTNDGQITSNNSSLSDWFGSLSWGAIGSDRSSNAYNNNRVTALDITNFGINDAVLESGNKTKLLFKFGEFDGAQDGNKDRTMIAWHRYNFTDNVDLPAGLGNFTNRNGNIDYRDIQPYAQRSDWPDANITGGPYNYSIWVR